EVTYFSVLKSDIDAATADANFGALQSCIETKGSVFLCKELGMTWMNRTLEPIRTNSPVSSYSLVASSSMMSTSAIVGITVALIALVFLCGFFLVLLWSRFRQRHPHRKDSDDLEPLVAS